MNVKTLVEVWDDREAWDKQESVATIGVNWSAVGPVTPETARKFAKEIRRAATRAEGRIARLKNLKKKYRFKNPEKIR